MNRLFPTIKMIILCLGVIMLLPALSSCVIDKGCTSDSQCPLGYSCATDGLCYLQQDDYIDLCDTDADCPGEGLCECVKEGGCTVDQKECTTLYLCESDLNCPDDGSRCNSFGYCDF